MPAARYWRLYVLSTVGGSYFSLKELQFLDANGALLSVGGVAFASSVYSSGWEADKAFDGNTATVWATVGSGLPAFIGYDHGSGVEVAYVRFLGDLASEYPTSAAVVALQWSDDNSVWTNSGPMRVVEGEFVHNQWCVLSFWDGTIGATLSAGGSLFVSSPTSPQGVQSVNLIGDSGTSYRDFEFGGFGRIAGTVKKDAEPDIPLKRRVRLHREQDGLLIREVWSHPTTGAYSFDYIDATKQYTVITYDYLHDYRAVIADNITPEAMP